MGLYTATISTTNAKAQQLLTLALPAWGYPPNPPPNADGTPGEPLSNTPQAQLEWALGEMADYLVRTARREHRRALESAEQGAINESVNGVGL